MKAGDLLLRNSDDCAAQYRCSTALLFLSSLATSHKIVIDRAISCPGHGKDIVDGVNGTTKTELSRASANHLKTAAEATNGESGVDTKKFAAAVAKDNEGLSAALECKRIFEFERTTGKKSNKKNKNRENRRAIQRMHYCLYRQLSIPSGRETANILGLNPRTFQRIQKKAQEKRNNLELVKDGILETPL